MDKRKVELIRELKIFKKKISKKYKIDKFILFGSRANGEVHKDSDVDLIVVSKSFDGVSVLKRAPDIHMQWDLDYAVDFVCYTPKEFDKLRKRVSIVSEALKNGVEI
ncbi:MAG: nucleotidyltransferase domain-containing protein [Nanoarchaeota archaeon]|nr:nucleotidyltransferase domain-containing protein [Nanoarchaeota archaeon]